MIFFKRTSILLLLNLSILCFSQDKDSLFLIKIETQTTENFISLQPTIQNKSLLHLDYNYLFLIKKKDAKQNLSVNKQSGRFTLEPQETKVLTSVQFNQSQNQNITAVLYIRDENENELIAKDSVEISAPQKEIKEISLLTSGIVIDESKTRFGKEFYDIFFSVYNQLPQKFKYLIQIQELPFRGQSSIIQIYADQDMVYEFLSNPDEEYNRLQVLNSFKKLKEFESKEENLNYEFNY